MPDFEGSNIIELQPMDTKLPFDFKIEYCTAISSNDGVIPYGYVASTVAVTAVKYPSYTVATAELIVGSTALTSNSSHAVLTVPLTYPVKSVAGVSTLGAGTYHMTMKIKLSGGTTRYKELNFNRVFARDK